MAIQNRCQPPSPSKETPRPPTCPGIWSSWLHVTKCRTSVDVQKFARPPCSYLWCEATVNRWKRNWHALCSSDRTCVGVSLCCEKSAAPLTCDPSDGICTHVGLLNRLRIDRSRWQKNVVARCPLAGFEGRKKPGTRRFGRSCCVYTFHLRNHSSELSHLFFLWGGGPWFGGNKSWHES